MAYTLVTPYQWQTWGAGATEFTPYSRLRGQTLIVNGTQVIATLTPSQDDLASASYYFLGGHEYEISDGQAQVLINAGYGDWVTPV